MRILRLSVLASAFCAGAPLLGAATPTRSRRAAKLQVQHNKTANISTASRNPYFIPAGAPPLGAESLHGGVGGDAFPPDSWAPDFAAPAAAAAAASPALAPGPAAGGADRCVHSEENIGCRYAGR
jgi:hypothetical protein